MGAVVVICANAVPKVLTPLIQSRCDPIAHQAIRRFTGWSLVIGGAAWATARKHLPVTDVGAAVAAVDRGRREPTKRFDSYDLEG
jgi:hypothetical protein